MRIHVEVEGAPPEVKKFTWEEINRTPGIYRSSGSLFISLGSDDVFFIYPLTSKLEGIEGCAWLKRARYRAWGTALFVSTDETVTLTFSAK